MKKLITLALLCFASAAAQNSLPKINNWNSGTYYAPRSLFIYCPVASCNTGQLYMSLSGGTILSVVQNVAGSGMTAGTYAATATGGGCTTEPAISVVVASATTLGTITITSFGAGCTSAPTFAPATGGTPPTFTVSLVYVSPLNLNPATYAGAYYQPLFGGIPFPNGTPIYTAGSGVTSVACASGYTCTSTRGELTIVGGTATTGTIATLQWGNYNGSDAITLPVAPGNCTVVQNGGSAMFALGHGTPSTTTLTITAGISIVGATVTVDYSCIP